MTAAADRRPTARVAAVSDRGPTGAGIALPAEDAAEVRGRFEGIRADLKPKSTLGRFLVGRVALFTIRLDRSALEESARLGSRVDGAGAAFDAARLAEVERLMDGLADHPAAHARQLRRTPEGIDRTIAAFLAVKADLHHPTQAIWTDDHRLRVLNLMGLQPDDFPIARVAMLSEAIDGRFAWLEPHEGAGLDDDRRSLWAMMALSDLIDAEVAKLREIRSTLDLEAIARDRAGAGHRALLDTSPEAALARKAEAAAERSLFRTLREFREVEPEAPEPAAETPEEPASLGSFRQAEPGPSPAPVIPVEPTRPSPTYSPVVHPGDAPQSIGWHGGGQF